MLAGNTPTEVLNLTLDYSDNGNITSVVQSSGGTNSPTFTNSYTYDAFDRLKTASSSATGSSPQSMFATEAYEFDSLSRMITRTVGSKVPDRVCHGQRLDVDVSTSYPLNSTTYGYDAVGNQVTRTYTPTNKVQNRTFDPENRVVQIVLRTRILPSSSMAPTESGSSRASLTPLLRVGKGESCLLQVQPSALCTWAVTKSSCLSTRPSPGPSPSNASASSPVYSLKKTGTNSAWDAGAISTQSITAHREMVVRVGGSRCH